MPKKQLVRSNSMKEKKTSLFGDQDQVLAKTMTGLSVGPVDVPVPDVKEKKAKDSVTIRLTDQEYYEQILQNSQNTELVKKIKDDDFLDSTGFASYSWKKPDQVFRQKLPVAKKDNKGRNLEEDDLAKAKKVFHNADLCTSREYAAMKEYFKNWKNMDGPGIEGKDEVNDPQLMQYVESITSVNIGTHMLTDDYLSEHIAEMYEYRRRLAMYDELKDTYPAFFDNLPEEVKSKIDINVSMEDDLKYLLNHHMYMHGVYVDIGQDEKVQLRKESDDRKKRNNERKESKENYERIRKEFCETHIRDREINLGRQYAYDGQADAEDTVSHLEERINGNKRAREACGGELQIAISEIRRTLGVRKELTEKQAELVRQLDREKGEAKREDIARQITRINRRITLTVKHAGHYREFIDLALGDIPRVSAQTAIFLQKENREGMLDIIKFKACGDILAESVELNDRLTIMERIAKLRAEKDPAKKNKAKEEADLLEAELRDGFQYIKMPKDTFLDKLVEYRTVAAKKSEEYTAKTKKGEELLKELEKRAQANAEKYHLVKVTDRTGLILSDPNGKPEDYELLYTACCYKCTAETPEVFRKQLQEKGLQPMLKKLLSLETEDLKNMDDPKKYDPNTDKYWKDKISASILSDVQDFLERLRNHNIEITKEEQAKLISMGYLGQTAKAEYELHEKSSKDPLYVLLNDRNVRNNIKGIYTQLMAYGSQKNPEIEKVYSNYSKDALGFDIYLEEKRSTFEVPDFIMDYVSVLNFKKGSEVPLDKFDETYQMYYKQTLNEIDISNKHKIEDEMESAKKYNDPWGENGARLKVRLKDDHKERVSRVSHDNKKRFKSAYDKGEGITNEEEAFSLLLRPVERDANGSVKKNHIADYWQNQYDTEDYLSGDKARKERVLKKFGKEMAEFSITKEMLDKDKFFDTTKQEYWDNINMLKRAKGLKLLYKNNAQFFESDEFTESERDKIKKNIVDNETLNDLIYIAEEYQRSYGANPDGSDYYQDKEPGNLMWKMKEWVPKRTKDLKTEAFSDYKRMQDRQKERVEKTEKAYEVHGDSLRRIGSLRARLLSRKAELDSKARLLKSRAGELKKGTKELKLLSEEYKKALRRASTVD
ncbi:MAG: hypothetical protein K6G42_09785, partial [Lachnospiraceae bacterium]|nr:hypothetical protein [Lachnospiraceae bacterium]